MSTSPDHTARLVLPAVLVILLTAAAPATAQNPIAIENLLPGTTDWMIPAENKVDRTDWNTAARSAAQIEGYASLTSVNRGETIRLFVNTAQPNYVMRFYRMGWYGGRGGREVLMVQQHGVEQPPCPRDPSTLMVDCDWTPTFQLRIPDDWVTGYYLVKLTAEQIRKENYIIFVVRDDSRASEFLMLSAVNTYQAYNLWGGGSLYPLDRGQGRKVSFNRPYDHWVQAAIGVGDFFAWEHNTVRWLEREGYDVAYATNVDAHARPDLLVNRRALLSVGHDEYWSWEMRRHVELARDRCVSLGFFSANSVYWQVRFEPSPVTGAPNRTMVSYKQDALSLDPLALDADLANDYLISGLWREPRPGFLVAQPEETLIGVMFAFFPVNVDLLVWPEAAGHWVFGGTSETRLPGLVGYEADRSFGIGPSGIELLARSPVPVVTGGSAIFDCDEAADTCYSHMTIYRAPSLALVFATGSIQWSFGLDSFAPPGADARIPANPAAQQVTRNVLERFRTNACEIDPEITIPAGVVADFGVSVPGIDDTGTVFLADCVRDGTCLGTSRLISRGHPTFMLYDRSELVQVPPVAFQAPVAPDHALIGPLWHVSTDASYTGPVRVTLNYTRVEVPARGETLLDVLYLADDGNGPTWKTAEFVQDAEADVIQATLPVLSTISLGLRPLEVQIDVKPGSSTNTINLGAAGVVPVAVLGSSTLDVGAIDVNSLTLGGGPVKIAGKSEKSLCRLEDSNQDGFTDLVCHMTNVTSHETVEGETVAVLQGRMLDGVVIRGRDVIRIVP